MVIHSLFYLLNAVVSVFAHSGPNLHVHFTDIRRLNLEADKVKPTTDETDVKEKYKYKEADKEKEEKMKEKDSESVIALPPEVERRGDTTNTPSTRQDTMSGRKDRDTVTSISTITPITGGETSTRVGGAVQEGGERGEGGGIGERGRGGQREKEARRTPSVSVSEQYDPNRVISLPASPGTSGEKGVEKIEEKKRSGTSLHSVSLPSSPSSPSSFPSSPSAVGSPSTGRPSTAHKINVSELSNILLYLYCIGACVFVVAKACMCNRSHNMF